MKNPRVLVAPLDWGLGHASRCIPIIHGLLALNCKVILAGDGNSLSLLKKEFPNQEYIHLKNHPISYPNNGNMVWHFLFRLPSMLKHIRTEHSALSALIEEKEIDAVISDNRYGLYNENLPSILITHQINPPINVFSSLIREKIRKLINRFHQCWIPDFSGVDSLAGKISKVDGQYIGSVYLGPVSRFRPNNKEKKYNCLCILSGPEPQRSILEKTLLNQLSELPGKQVIVRGTEAESTSNFPKNVEVISIADGERLEQYIDTAEHLISRSGYSSIMDYKVKGRKALLIPTPGQPEQIELAKNLKNGDQFIIQEQKSLSIKKALSEMALLPDPRPLNENKLLKEVLEDFTESLF